LGAPAPAPSLASISAISLEFITKLEPVTRATAMSCARRLAFFARTARTTATTMAQTTSSPTPVPIAKFAKDPCPPPPSPDWSLLPSPPGALVPFTAAVVRRGVVGFAFLVPVVVVAPLLLPGLAEGLAESVAAPDVAAAVPCGLVLCMRPVA